MREREPGKTFVSERRTSAELSSPRNKRGKEARHDVYLADDDDDAGGGDVEKKGVNEESRDK